VTTQIGGLRPYALVDEPLHRSLQIAATSSKRSRTALASGPEPQAGIFNEIQQRFGGLCIHKEASFYYLIKTLGSKPYSPRHWTVCI
jgi:hypothetical protein